MGYSPSAHRLCHGTKDLLYEEHTKALARTMHLDRLHNTLHHLGNPSIALSCFSARDKVVCHDHKYKGLSMSFGKASIRGLIEIGESPPNSIAGSTNAISSSLLYYIAFCLPITVEMLERARKGREDRGGHHNRHRNNPIRGNIRGNRSDGNSQRRHSSNDNYPDLQRRDRYGIRSGKEKAIGQSCNVCGKTNHTTNQCCQFPIPQNGNSQENGHNTHSYCMHCERPGHPTEVCWDMPFHMENQGHLMANNTSHSEQQGNWNNDKSKPDDQTHYEPHDNRDNQNGNRRTNQTSGGLFSSSSSARRTPHIRPIQGNSPDQYGNSVGFELPGMNVAHNQRDIDRFLHGKKWTETTSEYFVVDEDGDSLMCQCSGLTELLCLNYCARNLFNQKGQTMWISEHDRRVLEQARTDNHALLRHAETDEIL